MKAYKLEILVIDHDEVGGDGIISMIENTHYPNHCMAPRVKSSDVRDIGEWTDDHPLNHGDTAHAAYIELFGKPT